MSLCGGEGGLPKRPVIQVAFIALQKQHHGRVVSLWNFQDPESIAIAASGFLQGIVQYFSHNTGSESPFDERPLHQVLKCPFPVSDILIYVMPIDFFFQGGISQPPAQLLG